MATRIRLLNDNNAVWNERDFLTWHRYFISNVGAGFLNVHRNIEHLLNGGFETGDGSITASDWLGNDPFNAWYGFIAGTCTISLDTVEFNDGAQSLKIAQTVNNGSQISGARLTENASGFDLPDMRHLIPVKGGKTVRVDFALKTDTIASGSGKGAQVAVQAYTEEGVATGSEQVSTLVTGTSAWTDKTLDVTLPSDAAYIQVTARIVNTTGTAWFDSFVLTERGTDMEVTAQSPAAAQLDVSTGVAIFEIEDGDGNVFMIEFELEEAEEVTIANNASGNPRIDIIVAKYDNTVDPNVDADNVGTITVVQGTPAGSPTAPAVPANCIKIAEVYVANGASVFDESTVTDFRVPVTMRNMQIAPAASGDQIPSLQRAIASATPVQLGTVVLNEDPSDPSRPLVPTMEYPGLMTPEEKAQALIAIPSSDFTLGEAFPSDNPIPFAQNLTQNNLDSVEGNNWAAQSFTVPVNMTHIKIVDIDLGRRVAAGSWSSLSGNLNVSIYATSGGQPTGAALGTVQIPVAEIPGQNSTTGYTMLKRCTFASPIAVTPGAVYALVIEASGISGDSSNLCVRYSYNSSDSYSGGQKLTSANAGSSWSGSSHDMKFRVHGIVDDMIYPFYRQKSTYTELCICDESFNGSLSNLAAIYGGNNFSLIGFTAIGFDYLTRALIRFDKLGTPAQTINFELYAADSSGYPTGGVLATGSTFASASVSTSETDVPVTFNYQLTEGNRYVIKISMAGGGDGSNYVTTMVSANTTQPPLVDLYSTYTTDGGATYNDAWPSVTYSQRNPVIALMGYKKRTTDRIYRVDPTHPDRQRIIGYPTDISTPKVAGDSFELKMEGIIAGFSGLTPGADYFFPINGDYVTSGAEAIPTLLTNLSQLQSNLHIAFAGNFLRRLFDTGGIVYMGRAISATEMIRPPFATPEFICQMDDVNQSKAATSYLDIPKDARGAIVSIRMSSTNPMRREGLIAKYGKRVLSFEETTGTNAVTVTWNDTTGKLEFSDNVGGDRGTTDVLFFK
jgi:hypothetical protein